MEEVVRVMRSEDLYKGNVVHSPGRNFPRLWVWDPARESGHYEYDQDA